MNVLKLVLYLYFFILILVKFKLFYWVFCRIDFFIFMYVYFLIHFISCLVLVILVHQVNFNWKCCLCTEPFKGHCGGKNQSEWKKFRVGGKNIFKCLRLSQRYLRSLAKLLRSSRNFAFPRKTFAFSRKYFFFLSFARERKYLCERTQKFSKENAKFSRERKVLRENAKFLEGTQKFARERKKFCERTQSFSRERKSFARERKTFEKYFFLPPWIFFHSPRIFPTTMSLKGLRTFATSWKFLYLSLFFIL